MATSSLRPGPGGGRKRAENGQKRFSQKSKNPKLFLRTVTHFLRGHFPAYERPGGPAAPRPRGPAAWRRGGPRPRPGQAPAPGEAEKGPKTAKNDFQKIQKINKKSSGP